MTDPLADPIAEPVVQEERVLPWITALWTMLASLAVWGVERGIAFATWSSDRGWDNFHMSWSGFEYGTWRGLRFGLGMVVADRIAPRAWPRALRWAVGAGIGTLVLSPSGAWAYGRAIIESASYADQLLRGVPDYLIRAAIAACLGFWLGRMLSRDESRPIRTGARSGLDAGIVVGLLMMPFTIVHYLDSASSGFPLSEGLYFWLGLSVSQSAVRGLGYGFAVGLGLLMGRRVSRKRAEPPALGAGEWVRARFRRMFS